MENRYDAVVIGAGLGGLTAAAELARRKLRILVIEQHSRPGGAATAFRRGKFMYEAGLHMTATRGRDPELRELFRESGISDKLHFVPAPEFYCIHGHDFSFVFGNDIPDTIRRLKIQFPEESDAIDTYFHKIFSMSDTALRINQSRGLRHIFQMLAAPVLYRDTLKAMFANVGDFLDRTFRNERLKILLLANIGYYGDDPYQLSLLFFAIAQTGYYRQGGHYIRGGSHQLADTLADYITRKGGKIMTGVQVSKILVKDNKASGVEFYEKNRGKKQTKQIDVPYIIANAAIPHVLNELLEENTARRERKKIAKLEIAPSIMSVYIETDKPLSELGNAFYSTCFYDSRPFDLHGMADLHRTDYDQRPFILCDYSQIDAALAPEGKGYAVLSLFDYYADWAGLSPEAYRSKKAAAVTTQMERLYRKLPQMRGHVLRTEAATARTMERYLQTPQGSAYGFSQKPRQALLFRPGARSTVKNLYYASAWTLPGGGFGGAISGGKICADTILKDLGIR
ncbi:MAG: NAD(P)/FAD-dependent oxidoreductase [bacterium]|jgi:phytoene dehydrogenase-like protein|nr:NAD(P)/FAD-dependent oxidoreductase [bacterium]